MFIYVCIKFQIYITSSPAGFKTFDPRTIRNLVFVTPHNLIEKNWNFVSS